MLDEAKNAAEFNDYLRNAVYKFYTQTNLPVPKPEFIIETFWTRMATRVTETNVCKDHFWGTTKRTILATSVTVCLPGSRLKVETKFLQTRTVMQKTNRSHILNSIKNSMLLRRRKM